MLSIALRIFIFASDITSLECYNRTIRSHVAMLGILITTLHDRCSQQRTHIPLHDIYQTDEQLGLMLLDYRQQS